MAVFFYPFRERFWNPYPRQTGDPVHVVGFASSRGQIYSQTAQDFETFYISANNQAQFQSPIGEIYNAISGGQLFLKQGLVQTPFIGKFDKKPYPRTCFALDQEAKTLMIIVIDGKQRHYSEGVTLAELVEIVIGYGADSALNLDGGGSSTLVMASQTGEPIFLNSPSHAKMPGLERLIANHLGVYREP
jgi:exopolysaccharide biosynthesis protein